MFHNFARCRWSLGSILLLGFGVLSLSPAVRAQENYQPSATNLAAREWFQDAKFGLFIHWGVYSVSTGIKGSHFHRFGGSQESPDLVPADTSA